MNAVPLAAIDWTQGLYQKMNLASPKDKLDDLNRSYPISIQFASRTTINFLINTNMTTTLKKLKVGSPAGLIKTGAPTGLPSQPLVPNSQTPFADLMLKPQQLEAALRASDNAVADENFRHTQAGKSSRTSNDSKPGQKNTEFQLKAPSAISVKLAADFTNWEKSPLDLTKKADGTWSANVTLSPGRYHYRFIVDGTWCDDPNCAELIPNAYGSGNSVIEITR